MSYFKELRQFSSRYRLDAKNTIKLLVLYPLFKIHYWHYYGSGTKNHLARILFKFIPENTACTLWLYLPSFKTKHPVPVWFSPDRLTSFKEIFWNHAYALHMDWRPQSLIDAGANVGYASLYLAGHYPIKTVLAIEANPSLFPSLQRISESLKCVRVDMRIGIGALMSRTQDVELVIRSNSRDSFIVDPFSKKILDNDKFLLVHARSMTEWIQEAGFCEEDFQNQCLVKMDIEGSEHFLLDDDPRALLTPEFLVAEIHGQKFKRNSFINRLANFCTVLERRKPQGPEEAELIFSRVISQKPVKTTGKAKNQN